MSSRSWAEAWIESVASGGSTMSQRSVSSIERHGGGLDAVAEIARARGVHLVLLTDDKGAELLAASLYPFRVLA